MDDLGIDAALIAERERLDGARAVEFLEELPALVARWQAQLGVEGARIMPGGVLSGVFACIRVADRLPVVLKLAAQAGEDAAAEAAALAAWAGRGACKLLYASPDTRALLLERIEPGEAVTAGDESSDIASASKLLRTLQLRDGLPAQIPDAEGELRWRYERAHTMLDGASHARGAVTHADIEQAFAGALSLHRVCAERVLLHGDFINKNLLIGAGGEWRAIDPRPCIGDPAMDAGFWALAHRPNVRVRERCERFAQAAGLEPERVWAWARTFAVCEAVLVRDAERCQAHVAVAGL